MASSAATAAAAPPLLPPGTRPRSQGLWVGKKAEFSQDDPMANSSMLPLPSSTAPWADSLAQTVASYTGTKFSSILDEQVVRMPLVQIKVLYLHRNAGHGAAPSLGQGLVGLPQPAAARGFP